MKKALIQLHAAVFLWGFTGVLGRKISLNEGLLVWWRLLITILSLWLLFFLKKEIPTINRKDFFKIAGVGTLLSLHWLCFYGSIKYANVSVALTCLATSGLLSSLLEPIITRKKFNPTEVILGFFALAGIAFIYLTNIRFSTGIYIGILSSLLTVLVSILNKKLLLDYTPNQITLYQLSGGFLSLSLFMPLYLWVFPVKGYLPALADWPWLFILAWVCTILTFFLYISALQKISAFTMNLTLTLEPVYGIILAFILYKENNQLGLGFYVGFLLICTAVTLQMLRLKKQYPIKK